MTRSGHRVKSVRVGLGQVGSGHRSKVTWRTRSEPGSTSDTCVCVCVRARVCKALGIGRDINEEELRGIASPPGEHSTVFTVADFKDLNAILSEFMLDTCQHVNSSTTTTTASPTTTTTTTTTTAPTTTTTTTTTTATTTEFLPPFLGNNNKTSATA